MNTAVTITAIIAAVVVIQIIATTIRELASPKQETADDSKEAQ
ncbi:hypothetical protein [Streptomyces sp. SID4982]|nr:hypothetical protein [Streptomyces sp. SID4982]